MQKNHPENIKQSCMSDDSHQHDSTRKTGQRTDHSNEGDPDCVTEYSESTSGVDPLSCNLEENDVEDESEQGESCSERSESGRGADHGDFTNVGEDAEDGSEESEAGGDRMENEDVGESLDEGGRESRSSCETGDAE